MSSTPNIALSFLAVKKSNFTYDIFRRRLADDEEPVLGTRYLPQDCEEQSDPPVERHRYEVAFEPKPGFEQVRVPAWIEQGLTDEVLHQALVRRIPARDRGVGADVSVQP